MKKKLMFNVAFVGAIFALLSSQDAFAANANGTAQVTVDEGLTLTEDEVLDFGTRNLGDASVTFTGGVDAGDADWTVAGSPSASVTVTQPTDITITNGTDTLGVTTFTEATGFGVRSLDGSGNLVLEIGATLAAIPVSHSTGAYAGTYVLDVSY